MKKYEIQIPKLLAVGRVATNSLPILAITPMTITSKSSNGIYALGNEKAFKKKIDGAVISRIKNEPRNGFRLLHNTRTRSRGGHEHYYYLEHRDYPGNILLKYDNYLELIKNNTLVKGVFSEELIWSSQGMLSLEMVNTILDFNKAEAEKKKARETSVIEKRAFKKDLVPGKLYCTYDEEFNLKVVLNVCMINLEKGDYTLYHVLRQDTVKQVTNSIDNSGISNILLTLFSYYYDNILQGSNHSRQTISVPNSKGCRVFRMPYGAQMARTTAKLWELPTSHALSEKNVYANMKTEDLELFNNIIKSQRCIGIFGSNLQTSESNLDKVILDKVDKLKSECLESAL